MIQFTYEDVLLSLKEIVHDKGEHYIYPRAMQTCLYYEDNGEPSCIVGHFLHKHDILQADQEDIYEGNNAESLCDYLKLVDIAEFDDRSRLLLQEAQECQDWGYTWGNSLNTAVEAVTRKFGA